jgi:hypothetical protein
MRIADKLMSRCRVCGSREDVICYDPRELWAFFSRKTYCPDHCPDHDYIYDRYEGHYCGTCGKHPEEDWYPRD